MNFPHFISIMNQLCPNVQCLSRLKSKRFSNRGLSHHYNTFPMCLKAAQICVAVTANTAPTFLSPPSNPCCCEGDTNWNYNYNPWEDATDQSNSMLCQVSEVTHNMATHVPPQSNTSVNHIKCYIITQANNIVGATIGFHQSSRLFI